MLKNITTRTQRELNEGDILPKWYYGFAYRECCQDIDIFYPIPINYLVRLKMTIQHFWNKIRTKKSWFDKRLISVYNKGFEEGMRKRGLK